MDFYIQLGTAVLVLLSLVFHKLHYDKTAALVDSVKAQLGSK